MYQVFLTSLVCVPSCLSPPFLSIYSSLSSHLGLQKKVPSDFFPFTVSFCYKVSISSKLTGDELIPGPYLLYIFNVQGNFRHASSNNHVSREELMMVLSRLDGLHIRGLYFTETQRLTLGEVGLEEATSTGSGSIAYNVETCSCPPEYVGDSCQVGNFSLPFHYIILGMLLRAALM